MKLYTFNQLLQPIFSLDLRSIIKKYDGDKWSKTLKCQTFVKVMLFFQFGGYKSMRGLVAGLKSARDVHHHSGLKAISLNNLSQALMRKNSLIFEEIFCKFRDALIISMPTNTKNGRRVKREISAIDSTTISLCKEVFGWASFRKEVSGVKIHTEFSVTHGMPGEIVVTEARKHDSSQIKNMRIRPNVIYVFDRAYSCPKTLNSLAQTGASFVSRLKENIHYEVIKESELIEKSIEKGVISDQIIRFTGSTPYTGNKLHELRLVKYIDNHSNQEFMFITNVEDLAPITIAEIYKKRWAVELFFKAIKQNLKVKKFIGCSRNAVMIQIWSCLLAYLAFTSQKNKSQLEVSYANFMDIVRTNLFEYRYFLKDLVKRGTERILDKEKNIEIGQQMIFDF